MKEEPNSDDLAAAFTRHDTYGILGMGPISWGEKLRLAVLAVTVFPIKALGAVLTTLSFWLICHLSFLLPASCRNDVIAKLGNWFCRACLWWCGFWRVTWIRVGGTGASIGGSKGGDSGSGGGKGSGSGGEDGADDEPVVCIVSNHLSWIDILIHMSHSFPAFVARVETTRAPIIGIISKMMGCLYVDRTASGGGRVSDAVVQRMTDMAAGRLPGARPLLLFPEGTTTNGSYLLPFKTGAFLAGLPVRPVVIRYGEGRFSPCWEMIPAARHAFLLMANPLHSATCFELPLYRPSAAERADPKLYAANVRKLMLDFAGMRPTAATFQDKMALMKRLKQEHGMD